MSIHLQGIVSIIEQKIYSKGFCYPTPMSKSQLSDMKF